MFIFNSNFMKTKFHENPHLDQYQPVRFIGSVFNPLKTVVATMLRQSHKDKDLREYRDLLHLSIRSAQSLLYGHTT